jgi:beta-lactamase regulating signal transducer with metallopeptidase domain
MEPFLHITSAGSAVAVAALFSAIWEGTLLATLVLGCLRLLPRLSAASRSLIWMNVFLLLAVLHVAPEFRQHVSALNEAHVLTLDARWSVAIAGLWVSLSLWRAIQLMASAVRLRGLARRATPVEAAAALKAILRSGRATELCTSNEVSRPSVFGFVRPRILIPPALMEQLSALELQQVVLHEMEHLHRGDDWTNLLQKVGLTLFPLNPVMLWVERRVCAERELACDDRVLRATDTRKAYAACLTRLAEYSMIRHRLSLVLGAWERQSELALRVHRILDRPARAMKNRPAIAASGGLIVGALACAAGLAGSPQLISFVPTPNQAVARAVDGTPQRVTAQASDRTVAMNVSDSEGAARPQLVEAVMNRRPLTAPSTSQELQRGSASQAGLMRVVQRGEARKQAWVVLTQWNDVDGESAPRVVFAVDQGANDRDVNDQNSSDRNSNDSDSQQTQPRYAAIPLINGWLIVQI